MRRSCVFALPEAHNACADNMIRVYAHDNALDVRTRELGVRVVADDGGDDEDSNGTAIGVELGGDVVVGLGDEHGVYGRCYWILGGRWQS